MSIYYIRTEIGGDNFDLLVRAESFQQATRLWFDHLNIARSWGVEDEGEFEVMNRPSGDDTIHEITLHLLPSDGPMEPLQWDLMETRFVGFDWAS